MNAMDEYRWMSIEMRGNHFPFCLLLLICGCICGLIQNATTTVFQKKSAQTFGVLLLPIGIARSLFFVIGLVILHFHTFLGATHTCYTTKQDDKTHKKHKKQNHSIQWKENNTKRKLDTKIHKKKHELI